jgi:hypothetical protein
MPRCPLCRSVLVTITFGLYPIAICTSCGARWVQDGRQQRAINQIQGVQRFSGGSSGGNDAVGVACCVHPLLLLG